MTDATVKPYTNYGSSGVEWLGEIPTHWEVRRIKSLARPDRKSFVDGDWIELPFITSDGIRLIQTGNIGVGEYREKGYRYITEETFRALNCTEFRPGDVLICRLGEPVARACLAPELGKRMITSVDVCILKPRNNISPKFAVYAMSSPSYLNWVGSLVRGSTRDRVSRSMLGKFTVPLPPPSEQCAIVRYLDHADSRARRYISAKERLIELLTEQRQAVINQAVTRGLDPDVPLKPSGVEWLGDVPAHWDVRRGKRLFSPRRELARANDIQLSATQAYGVIPQDEYERRVGRRVVKVSLNLDKRRHVEVDDFVISMRSFQGGLERAWSSGCIRSSYIVLRPSIEVDVEFFSHVFKSQAYIQALQSTANFIRDGQDLNFNNFCAVDLPFPPAKEQQKIAIALGEATTGIDDAMSRSRRQIELMHEYRTRLIADVVTGKLDVRGAVADEVEIPTP